jgi:demethylmenaquinone methyltransferase/2-methoxy-6-polyprenyl-1,4-benzoquinol methylase
MSRAELDKSPVTWPRCSMMSLPATTARTAVLSMGMDRSWRRVVADTVALKPGEVALDLAAGTGTSSRPSRSVAGTSSHVTSVWGCFGKAGAAGCRPLS